MIRLMTAILAATFAWQALAQTPVDRFERIATFDITGTVAEIVAATPDGRTLVYTDGTEKRIAFVDISDPRAPRQTATLATPGEPTSVAITPDGRFALVAVNGEPGVLAAVELSSRTIVRTIEVGGQPDSVAVSPDGRFAVMAVENERDETVNGGRMPQSPAGLVTIVTLGADFASWTARQVSLTGLAGRFPDDPEPEFVDINAANIAAVTLQENNHIVLIDVVNARVTSHFSAGTTTHAADVANDGEIALTSSITGARREPDAITWTPGGRLVTANEGDYTVDLASGQFAGGRDFTIFNSDGSVAYEPGASLELEAARSGHYPDSRSRTKGIEAEAAEIGVFGNRQFLFIGSERGDFVAVYRLDSETNPTFVQILPTGDAPEGLIAIPSRNLLVTANEGDGTLSIFEGVSGNAPPSYPFLTSDAGGWGALSGLVSDHGNILYGVPDSAMKPSRIWTISDSGPGWKITSSLPLPKNYDLEGIARISGGWWVVSEGAGNAGGTGVTKNLLVRVNQNGTIAEEVELPAAVNAQQRQFGFEGVATNEAGTEIYVAFQREWGDDPVSRVKIGRYSTSSREWRFFHYPIEAAPTGGWVGLSEVARLDDTTFLVIERDNQKRRAASIKRIYRISIAGVEPAVAGAQPPLLTKTLVRDLLVEDAWRIEKAESLAVTPAGLVIASDNDGAGETLFVKLLRAGRIWPRRR